jgi:hypothetical protein
MIRLFIKECLLFNSTFAFNRLLGVLGWFSIVLFMSAMGMLIFLLLKESM